MAACSTTAARRSFTSAATGASSSLSTIESIRSGSTAEMRVSPFGLCLGQLSEEIAQGVKRHPSRDMAREVANRESAFTILKAVALASSLNILLGYTGYVSFGHIVFYGFGGYVGLFLLTEQGWSLWTAILAGGLAFRGRGPVRGR